MGIKKTANEKTILIKDYIPLAGVTAASISYRIKNNKNLPGISKYYFDITSRCYMLVRDERIEDKDIRQYFREKVVA